MRLGQGSALWSKSSEPYNLVIDERGTYRRRHSRHPSRAVAPASACPSRQSADPSVQHRHRDVPLGTRSETVVLIRVVRATNGTIASVAICLVSWNHVSYARALKICRQHDTCLVTLVDLDMLAGISSAKSGGEAHMRSASAEQLLVMC